MAINPASNVVIADGYSGPPRKGCNTCSTSGKCARIDQCLADGEHSEVGCHEATWNVICNAAANGTALRGALLITTHAPSLMGAKLIHHAGIIEVLIVHRCDDSNPGVQYLRTHEVPVLFLHGQGESHEHD